LFGLFKKEIGWKDVEFMFIVSAAEVYKKLPLTMPADSVRDAIQRTIQAGNLKLSPPQQNAIEMACITMQLSSDLKNMLKKTIEKDGSLNQHGVIELIDAMPRFGIFFRDTPTMADLQKSIFGS
jgi:hypothetical protein